MLIDFARELVDTTLMIKGYGVDLTRGDTDHLTDSDRAVARAAIAEHGAMVRATAYTLGHVYCTMPHTVGARDWHNACGRIRAAVYAVCAGYTAHNLTGRNRSMVYLELEDRLTMLRAQARV